MILKDAIKYVGENKDKPAASTKQLGIVTFSECRELIKDFHLDNEGNRDEDLDSEEKYYNKLHHLIRYMSGISEKGQLLISILKDNSSKVGYIRDNGTMFALTFGKYYDTKVITGNGWIFMCDDIMKDYDINNEDDKYVINLILNFFESKKEEQLSFKYSLKDIVESSDEFKSFYDGVEIGFAVSLHTIKQFERDMVNCNRQPNPWIAYNHYMTPHKRTDEYKTYFCGDKLLEYFDDKIGAHIFERGKLIYGHQSYAEKHKVARLIPILQSYIGSHYCETIDDFKKFNDMVVKFERGKDGGTKETDYWSSMFKKVINDVTYTNMTDWYEKHYKPLFESNKWDNITTQINKMVFNKLNGSKVQSMEDLHIKKYHTGILMMSFVLHFKRKYPRVGIDKIIEKIVNEYVRLLSGDVNHNNENIPVWEYFGTERDFYQSTNVDARWEKIFKYVFQNIQSDFNNRSKDRDKQYDYRHNVLKRTSSFFESESILPRLTLFPLSTDNLCVINFSNGEGLHWLHKTPHSSGGNADDGFLGMTDDNLTGNQKYKNWNCEPNEYWLLVADRNEDMLDNYPLNVVEHKMVRRSIDIIYQLVEGVNLKA